MSRPSAPFRPPLRGAPSITRLFWGTFVAVTLAVLAVAFWTWATASDAERQVTEMIQSLDQVQRTTPLPILEAERARLQELAADLGDDSAQTAMATTIVVGSLLLALGIGLLYSRRRLAAPFQTILAALERVGAGHYDQRLPEEAPDEFGTIARGVNQLADGLAWRARMQDYTSRLLAALNAAPREGPTLGAALPILAEATGAAGVVLYQPDVEANEWRPAAAHAATAGPLSRILVRDLVGDGTGPVLHHTGEDGTQIRQRLGLPVNGSRACVLAPLRSAGRLVGLLVVLPESVLDADQDAALGLALPNLAIACERESAYHNMRRLATDVRRTAQHLEEQADELQRLNEELAQANRLKSQFLANMSHELRTPLNSIIGFSDLLLTADLGPLSEQQRDFLDTVARNGRHLLQLINELLDLSKIEAGRLQLQREPFALAPALAEAVDSVRAQADQRHHVLTLDVPSTPVAVSADRVRLRQILLNLLSNAIKFTPDGGKVTLSARPEETTVRIAVTDTGVGIAPEDRDKLFREFSQLDGSSSRPYEGTGLGLALVKRLAELHGGAVGVESAMGRGSTFWVTLPLAARPSEGVNA